MDLNENVTLALETKLHTVPNLCIRSSVFNLLLFARLVSEKPLRPVFCIEVETCRNRVTYLRTLHEGAVLRTSKKPLHPFPEGYKS